MPAVTFIYLPHKDDGGKQGVDDYLSAGHTVGELLDLRTTELREPPREEDEGSVGHLPYRATPNGLVWDKPTQNGVVSTLLTNFTARIVNDLKRDDGVEVERSFEVEATLGEETRRFSVPSTKFNGMGWVTDHLGSKAIIYPGYSIKDHARTAVQALSEDISERVVFSHTGWREAGGEWIYLHAVGFVGSVEGERDLEVELGSSLSGYALPSPPEVFSLRRAVRESLWLWELAPDEKMVSLHAATYRAAMGETDFSIHLAGPTGEGKSELAALCQQHFGAGLDARSLASWESTDNALESRAFILKDSLMVIDDFSPAGTSYDVQRLHKKADRLMRGKGNASGRERMSANLELSPPKPPRALILSTGEDTPHGQSLRARMLILELGPGELDWEKLTSCQEKASDEVYAQALAGFASWLAGDYADLRERLLREARELREKASSAGGHRRTPNIVAELGLGLRYFLEFAKDCGAITPEEAEELFERGWEAITGAAASQESHQTASEPAKRHLDLLSSAVASGRAHLATTDGKKPTDYARALGWQERVIEGGDLDGEEWRPQGDRIGWMDGDNLYLEPEASYRIAQSQAQGGEPLSIGTSTLRKRLNEKGLLRSTDGKRQTLTVRRTIEGVKDRSVLHLHFNSLFSPDTEPDESDGGGVDPHSTGGSSPSGSRGLAEETDGGPDKASDSAAARQISDSRPDDGGARSHGENATGRRVRRVLEGSFAHSEDEEIPAPQSNGHADRAVASGRHLLIDTPAGLEGLLAKLQEVEEIAVDLETTGLDPRRDRARLISLAAAEGTWLVDCSVVDPSPLFLILAERTLVFHNAIFDLGFLYEMGFELGEGGEVLDTMLMSQVAENIDATGDEQEAA